MERRRPDLVQALKQIDDFYMELKWDFHSWLPLVSRILPSDICKIYKRGCQIRLDTTLVDFSEMKWERGDISFLFRGDWAPKDSLTVLDREYRCYQRVRYEESDSEIEDEVDLLVGCSYKNCSSTFVVVLFYFVFTLRVFSLFKMSNDIMAAQMSTKGINFARSQSGWIFREDRREVVAGQFDCELYSINGLQLESRKRREHLSRDDLQKNKAIMESLIKGGGHQLSSGKSPPSSSANQLTYADDNDDDDGDEDGVVDREGPPRRDSLLPPPATKCTWDEYIAAEPGKHPVLGRAVVYKESAKSFKATLAMSKDFPLTVETLLDVLEVVAPFKHFAKLREFIKMKLPPGFPVKIDIPILPTITATVTFQKFEFRKDFPVDMFDIPANFLEDTLRFPDL